MNGYCVGITKATDAISAAYACSYMQSRAASTGSMHDGHVKDLISQSSMQSLW